MTIEFISGRLDRKTMCVTSLPSFMRFPIQPTTCPYHIITDGEENGKTVAEVDHLIYVRRIGTNKYYFDKIEAV